MTQKVIFFDIDGTLLNTGGAGQLAMERALTGDFQIDFPFEGVLTAGRTDRGITDEIFGRYRLQNTAANRARFRDAYLSHLPATLDDAPGLLLPGVIDLLNGLRQADSAVLSLLTGNYATGARIKLQHYKLADYFVSGGFGDDHADRDDVARLALTAIAAHLEEQVEGCNTMVIGDTPADIKCARAIEAKAVAVATGRYSREELQACEPDFLFDDFSDAVDAVDRLLKLL
ncbi:MAG: HAD family hydrolase [Fuerstiella sp.]